MLDKDVIHRLIQIMLDGDADFCDVYCEESAYNGVTSDDRKLNTSRSVQSGIGLRAVKDFNTYYTVCQDVTPETLIDAAKYLVSGLSVASTSPKQPLILNYGNGNDLYSHVKTDPAATEIETKFDLVREAQDTAWGYSDKIKQVTARYSDFHRNILIGSSESSEIIKQRLGLVEFMITVYAGNGKERQLGWAGKSFYKGMEALTGDDSPRRFAEAACKQAHTMLEAAECPRGEVPVVFAPGENGILFHESCGHGMEADLVMKGSSFADKVGELVASEKVTIHDDGTLPGFPGSYAYDDEAVPAQDTILIENGRLTGYLHDLVTSKRLRQSPTGSGRRQNFKFPPMPRMRNTYIVAGEDDPEEIIRTTTKGIYAADVGFGGQVDVVTGRFITSILLGYLIEDGKLTRPVKGATITGIGMDALKGIDMVGNDLEINHSPGRCGKGQEVPVGVGMPTLRVKKLTVGGTGSSF
ncbi:MAG: TldD/PmbA family protein [candidate division Zixibacteria bacterium]|nr:TldD/PmbA family protein [candidate division Zixibacteria bacterium]MBU1469975.1 TldD/PmbA family protein [candidate division Zixibacteria bacterium]MBU2624342.1 TldD/PmbA family protein [candidate division Zixibacteria bacterium]